MREPTDKAVYQIRQFRTAYFVYRCFNLCMLFSLLNPLAAYMGYYGNITGDSGLMNLYCGRIGIDSSTQTFSFLFYKAASIVCILMGIAFIALAVWQMEKQAKE